MPSPKNSETESEVSQENVGARSDKEKLEQAESDYSEDLADLVDQYAKETVRDKPIVIAKGPLPLLSSNEALNSVSKSGEEDRLTKPLHKLIRDGVVFRRPSESVSKSAAAGQGKTETKLPEAVKVIGGTAVTSSSPTAPSLTTSADARASMTTSTVSTSTTMIVTSTTLTTTTVTATTTSTSAPATGTPTVTKQVEEATSSAIRRVYVATYDESVGPIPEGSDYVSQSEDEHDGLDTQDGPKVKPLYEDDQDSQGDLDVVESFPLPPETSTMGEPLPPADLPTAKPARKPSGDSDETKEEQEEEDWQDYQQHPPVWDLEEEGDEDGGNVIVFDHRPSSFLTRKEGVERLAEGGGMMVVVAPKKFTQDTMVGVLPWIFFN